MTQELDELGVPKPAFRISFSQWETYQQCPQKWHFASRLKLPRTPPGPAAARGLHMHDRAEQYIKGEIDDVNSWAPDTMFGDKYPALINKKYIPILDQLRNHPNGDRHTEKKFGFDSEWCLCSTGSKFVSFVAVLDAARVGGNRFDKNDSDNGWTFVYEWKSGQKKDTHVDQRKIYAMIAYKAWMNPVRVTTYYLEDTSPPEALVLKDDAGFDRLRATWQARIDEMRTNEMCSPRPGFYCRWCDFAKSKGGPCQFGA